MADWKQKLIKAAFRAGEKAKEDSRLAKAAGTVKAAVDSFREGYREQSEPEKYKKACPHCRQALPEGAKYCPGCGAKVD